MRPLVAVAGTWAVIWWSESMLGAVAGTSRNLTVCTSVKPEPVMVTLVPAGPLPGPKEVIRGSTRKVLALWPLPEGVTTVSLPVEASAGTTTVILVALTVAGAARTPLKRTLVAPPKALPAIVSVVPTGAAPGVTEPTRGMTNSVAALVAVPPAVVIVTGPSVALAGTVSRSCVRESTLNPALTLFTFTALTPPKPVPRRSTGLPGAAWDGANVVIAGRTRNTVGLAAVPPAVVTVIRPLNAVGGAKAVITLLKMSTRAGTPANLTMFRSAKPEPSIVTPVSAGPLPGVMEVSCGRTRNFPTLWAIPTGVATSRWPVLASAGTTARTCVGDTKVGAVATPPNETDVAPSRFAPPIVTTVPTGAAAGLKPEILGAGARTARLCPNAAAIA